MGQIDDIVTRTKAIESRLVRDFGAQGRGLHEKLDSVANQLDDKVVRACRYVATIRNKALHEEAFTLSASELDQFIERCDWIDASMGQSPRDGRREPTGRTSRRSLREVLVFVVGLLAVVFVPMFLAVRPLLTWLKIPDAGPREFWYDVKATGLAMLAVLIILALIVRLVRNLRR